MEFVLIGLKDNFERAMTAKPVYDHDGDPTGEFTYQGSVANRSLELIGNHLKMFQQKLDVTSNGETIKFFGGIIPEDV